MLRVFKPLFLITLFVTFTNQASAMFIQPDWLDPTEPGVGTNRYSYCFNDPVNCFDPNGNSAEDPTIADEVIDKVAKAIHRFLESVFSSHNWDSRNAIVDIPGVDMLPGVATGVAIADDAPPSQIATEIVLETIGVVAKGIKVGRTMLPGGTGKGTRIASSVELPDGLVTKRISDPKNWNGCEECAQSIQSIIGGDVVRVTPKGGTRVLGGYRGVNPGWAHHEVVVKDGRVYDAFSGKSGMPVADYKGLFEYPDYIDFGF